MYTSILKTSLLILTGIISLAGCSVLHVTKVYNDHPLLHNDTLEESAMVYFIRPKTEHPQGFSDNPLKVYADDALLMTLGKGEYTLAYLKGQPMSLTLTNLTQSRGWWEIEQMEQTRQFDFHSGQTYFIVAQPVDGEFRGVHFLPQSLSQFEAKQIISKMIRPVGKAEKSPIK